LKEYADHPKKFEEIELQALLDENSAPTLEELTKAQMLVNQLFFIICT